MRYTAAVKFKKQTFMTLVPSKGNTTMALFKRYQI